MFSLVSMLLVDLISSFDGFKLYYSTYVVGCKFAAKDGFFPLRSMYLLLVKLDRLMCSINISKC